jgi:predicted esterase
MIIALHGNGDNPAHFYETLLKEFNRPARFILLKGPISFGGSGGEWPIDLVRLREYGDALADAVPVLLERFPTAGSPIVLGFSGGAYYAYYLAARYADQFSYIFPLSGALPGDIMEAEPLPYDIGADIIAFHGIKDQVVGFNHGKAAVESLKKMGLRAELVTFNGGHIDIFLSAKPALMERLEGAVN